MTKYLALELLTPTCNANSLDIQAKAILKTNIFCQVYKSDFQVVLEEGSIIPNNQLNFCIPEFTRKLGLQGFESKRHANSDCIPCIEIPRQNATYEESNQINKRYNSYGTCNI